MKMGSDWKSALDCPVFHENFAAALQPSSWTYFEAPGHFLSARGEAFNAQDMFFLGLRELAPAARGGITQPRTDTLYVEGILFSVALLHVHTIIEHA